MTWPFKVPENKPAVDPANANPESGPDPAKPAEKSPAEILAEALRPLSDKLDSFNTELTSLKESIAKPTPKPVEPGQPLSVFDDENAAFAARMTPLFARQLELESRVVYNDIKTEYIRAGFEDLWTKYESEIKQVIDNSPLVTADGKPQRGDPQYVRNVVDMVLGRAARAAGMRFDGKTKGFFLEPAGGDAGSAPKPEGDGLTDAQRKVMERMGISPEKGKDTMKHLQFVQ